MAGIGFELRKLFDQNSITSKIQVVIFASTVTIGPVLLVISSLMLIQVMQSHLDVPYIDKELLANTILYVFIFALLVIAPLDSALSRYISDKIFENDYDGVMPAYYVGLCVNLTIASVMGTVFCILTVLIGGVSPIFTLCAFFLFIAVVLTFYSMTFTTLKLQEQIEHPVKIKYLHFVAW